MSNGMTDDRQPLVEAAFADRDLLQRAEHADAVRSALADLDAEDGTFHPPGEPSDHAAEDPVEQERPDQDHEYLADRSRQPVGGLGQPDRAGPVEYGPAGHAGLVTAGLEQERGIRGVGLPEHYPSVVLV